MKHITISFLFFSIFGFSQSIENFTVELEPITIANAPSVHSFSWGMDTQGRWLIIGGRIDGLHQRQPFAAFLANDNNKNAFVIDPVSEQVWNASLSMLADPMFEQLQATNQQFFQRENQLYIIGGYGYSPSVDDHITFPYLTAIDVDEVTQAIINGNSITSYFRQMTDANLAVTGGQLGYLDEVFYLAGGQYFEGRYNPMGPTHGPGFIQEYTDAIRKFKIIDDGTVLSILEYSEDVDTNNLHRRDYNMSPQIFPNGEKGFTMFSGVFQKNVDLPFLNSVDFTADGFTVNNNFNQYLSQYHSAHLPIFDEENNKMHTVFFGGMSQFTLDANGNLVEDENVPFVKTISRVTRLSDGSMEEMKLDIEMPTLVGAGAAFIPASDALSSEFGILDLNEISEQKRLVGYIYGGIESTQENIFFINNGNQSFASNVIFKVFIDQTTTATNELKTADEKVFQMKIYPNPTDSQLVIEYFNPYAEKVLIKLSDGKGSLIATVFEGQVAAGEQRLVANLPELEVGTYFISIENRTHRNTKAIVIQ